MLFRYKPRIGGELAQNFQTTTKELPQNYRKKAKTWLFLVDDLGEMGQIGRNSCGVDVWGLVFAEPATLNNQKELPKNAA